jgi:hypothetical protein
MSSEQKHDEIEPRRLVELADEIRTEVDAAEADYHSAVQHAVNAGDKLIEAKGLCQHGDWLTWLKENFQGGVSTAQLYMQLARGKDQISNALGIREAVAQLTGPRQPVRVNPHWRAKPGSEEPTTRTIHVPGPDGQQAASPKWEAAAQASQQRPDMFAVKSETEPGDEAAEGRAFDLLLKVGEHLDHAEKAMDKLEAAIDRKPNQTFLDKAEKYAGWARDLAEHLRSVGKDEAS